MGIISKLKDYFVLSANERVNKMYVDNPDLFIKKMEQDKEEAIVRITNTAITILRTKDEWSDEMNNLQSSLSSLDARINQAVSNGDEQLANSLASTWKEQKRIHTFYENGSKKLEAKYNELVKAHRDINVMYDTKIQTVKSTLCAYSVNKEILRATNVMNGLTLDGVESPDIAELVKSLNEENTKIEAKMKVITDFKLDKSFVPNEVVSDTSALNEWKNHHNG